MRKPVLCHVNKKGAEQPANPHSLINTFVVHWLDSVIPILAKFKISRLQLMSVTDLAGLSLTRAQPPRDRFSHDMAYFMFLKSTVA